jgi:hypothetical protein
LNCRLVMPRMARCFCGQEVPSSEHERLAFFQYRGEGSRDAEEVCKHCRYHEVAHTDQEDMRGRINVVASGRCKGFEPHGPWDHDTYYCGCRGWD